MNMEELKSVWEGYDKKVQAAQSISEKIIESIIRERSQSRVSKIKRQSHGFFVMLFVEAAALIAVFWGNPFDFKYDWQFIPFVLVFGGVLVAFFNLALIYGKINAARSHQNIETFLKNIVEAYEKNRIFERWFGVILLSLGALVPFAFLPHKIERSGWAAALLDIGIMISITLILYGLAFKFGAFKSRHAEYFKKDYAELTELKSMIAGNEA